MTSGPTARDVRYAAVADVLARAVREGEVEAADALRILKHELRKRNTNRSLKVPERSERAQQVIDDYARRKKAIPKNGSDDALHADHVNPLTEDVLYRLTTTGAWLAALPDLMRVVCVTAAENYALEQVERTGVRGEAKYGLAGITLLTVGV